MFDPGIGFLIMLFSYGMSAYFINIENGTLNPNIELQFAAALIIGTMAFIIGYKMPPFRLSNISFDKEKKENFSLAITITLLAILFNIIDIEKIINILKFNPSPYTETAYRASRSAESGPKAFFSEIGLHLIFFSLLVYGYNKKKIPFVGFGLIFIIAAYYFKGGSKGILIYAMCILLIYINYRVKQLNWIFISIVFILMMAIFSVFSHVRYVSDIGAMLEIGLQLIREDAFILLPVAFGEFTGPPGTLINIIQAIESNLNLYTYGKTWINELLVYIPYFIFPDRPLPTSELYMEIFMPNAPRGSGEGWFIISDGYWSFGQIGVFFIMFLYGLMLKFVYYYFTQNKDKSYALLVYPYIYFLLVITSVRTGFFGTMKLFLMYMIIMYAILALSKIKYK